jgi:hypothetical protein
MKAAHGPGDERYGVIGALPPHPGPVPFYALVLLCRAGTALSRVLEVNAADLRALLAYQQALARQRCDAEHCIVRIMIHTRTKHAIIYVVMH